MNAESSDEELPDIFQFGSQPTPLSEELFVGNIVWALYRNLYWPALIRSVRKKDKIVVVWYLDSPGKSFKVPFRKVLSFKDRDSCQKIHEEARMSPMKQQHEDIFMKALVFKKRQIEGKIDDPRKFFDPSAAYLAFYDLNHTPNSSFVSNRLPLVNTEFDTQNSSSDSEASIGSEADTKSFSKYASSLHIPDNDTEIEKESAIVAYIKSGELDKYLIDIKKRRIGSKWGDFFENSLKTDANKLLTINPCSNMTNLKRLSDIVSYLKNLYETNIVGEKNILVKYVHYVWVPEALEKAVSSLEGNLKSTEIQLNRELFTENDSCTEQIEKKSKSKRLKRSFTSKKYSSVSNGKCEVKNEKSEKKSCDKIKVKKSNATVSTVERRSGRIAAQCHSPQY